MEPSLSSKHRAIHQHEHALTYGSPSYSAGSAAFKKFYLCQCSQWAALAAKKQRARCRDFQKQLGCIKTVAYSGRDSCCGGSSQTSRAIQTPVLQSFESFLCLTRLSPKTASKLDRRAT